MPLFCQLRELGFGLLKFLSRVFHCGTEFVLLATVIINSFSEFLFSHFQALLGTGDGALKFGALIFGTGLLGGSTSLRCGNNICCRGAGYGTSGSGWCTWRCT